MKKYIILLSIALLCISCDLNQFPYSEVAEDEYVKDEYSVNNLVMGAYNALQDVMFYEWALTEVRSDNARMRINGSTAAETKLIEQLDQNVVLTAHSWIQNYWDKSYAAIARVNGIFPSLDVVDDAQKKAQFEGEARFLRAHLYFNLVRLWGPVFIVTKKIGSDEARYMHRSSSEEVYELIESDLEAIVEGELLPNALSQNDMGRADMKAAKALLAKVYMTHYKFGEEKYEAAKSLLEDVIEACGNPQTVSALVPYADVFDYNNECNKEIIFAVRYLSGNVGIGCPFSTLFGPLNNGGNVVLGSPKHYNYPSDNLANSYAETDCRKDVVMQEGYYNSTTDQYVISRYCNKFMQNDMANEYDAENDWPIIRLGDVLLLYAEVSNELSGPNDAALKYLNMIRERAGVPTYSLSDLNSKYAFREAVRNERRLELAMENQRWFDLQRWGQTVNVINNYYKSEVFYSGYDYIVNPIAQWQTLLPIPVSVINVNKQIAQNPGY